MALEMEVDDAAEAESVGGTKFSANPAQVSLPSQTKQHAPLRDDLPGSLWWDLAAAAGAEFHIADGGFTNLQVCFSL
jgi:hypothetical protein